MVKGVSRRVVVVKCPETRLFDEAIFMVRDDAAWEESEAPEKILKEACRAADSYIRSDAKRKRKSRQPLILGSLAALAVCIAAVVLLW